MKIKTCLMVVITMLSGCANMNGQFDCPIGTKVSCKSMKEIDQMVSSGEFSGDAKGKTIRKINVIRQNLLGNQQPKREPDYVMSIWFAPFIDSDTNYHQESTVYTVINPSHWKGNPVNSPDGISS